MTTINTGDMARGFLLQRQHMQARADLNRLTEELASGQHKDIGRALKGDFTALAGITHGLDMTEAYRSAASEAGLLTSVAQAALEAVQTNLDDIGPALLAATRGGSEQQMSLVSDSARNRLDSMVASLNQTAAGRGLFSGANTDSDALVSTDDLLALLDPLATGAADAADLVATLESWFMDPGGGYETLAHLGSPETPALVVAQGVALDNPLTALDPGLRRALMGMALATLANQGSGGFGPDGQRQLLEAAAVNIVESQAGVTDLRARLGHVEGRIAAAQVQNDSTRAALDLERSRLTSVDPYATATRLQQAKTRLESLYLLTTRLSRLSLTEFLR